MHKVFHAAVIAGLLAFACPLRAQQVCPGFTILIDTPEDALMLAVTGAETPQEQIAALDEYTQEHPDSKFMPCVHEYYTLAYLRLNEFDKVIEHGEAGLSGDYQDVMLMMNLLKGYVATNKISDFPFQVIMRALEEIKKENAPVRVADITDEQWEEIRQQAEAQGQEQTAYMEYAFFQLLQREPDPSNRLEWLEEFAKAYPDSPNQAQINFNYFIAYKLANNPEKIDEYGEKTVAADPENVAYLNLVADDYATRQTNLDQAEEYAKKALDLAPQMEKSPGMTDEQFKAHQNQQLGLAHFTIGHVAFQRGAQRHRVAPAIDEFKEAIDLLEGNPALQGRALFYLGYAYEVLSPPNHQGAIDALTKAVNLQSPWQSQAEELLAKVKAAAH